ncbi:hypothetical protein L6468_09855 [Prevotella communis]|uniref:hypothetical protein n=1 Tax=Prevotella communis TaxID=2913614 RepID=UPI001EDA972A|nr:hypothetical protein [Prevotella communis]UKK61295.1 hypothetical protein L6468_09855 [Prevotella communis]UKK64120.1 hypothetical protein L6473_09860 [Prevotella communis]
MKNLQLIMKRFLLLALPMMLMSLISGCGDDDRIDNTPVYCDITKAELESVPSFKYENLYIKFRNGHLITQQVVDSWVCNQDTMSYVLSGTNIDVTFVTYGIPTKYKGTIQKITQEGVPNKLYLQLDRSKQVGIWLSNAYEWCNTDF